MTPVEAGKTMASGNPKSVAAVFEDTAAAVSPAAPVQALALPLFTRIAWAWPRRSRLLAEKHRGGLHLISGKYPRGSGRLIRHNQGQVQTTGLFDGGLYRSGFKSGDEQVFYLFHGIILKKVD